MYETKQKRSFKETARNAGNKVKTYAGQKWESAKSYGRTYKSDIGKAYDIGYANGWENAYNIPNRFGAKTAASVGFSRGATNRRKSDKYIKRYKK